jgi:predicted ribosomally synthesized peptide with SipW-like signal peptide
MKKIFALSISALLIMGLVGGGTWAFFTDTATSAGNTWTAGTLVLNEATTGSATNSSFVVTPDGGINGSVQFGLTDPVKPGSSGTITWTLSDTGNVGGTLTLDAATTFGQGGAPNAPEAAAETALGGVKGLDTGIMVWVSRGATNVYGTTGTYLAMSDLAAALHADSAVMVGTPPGTAVVYVLHWNVPTTVGSEIQGDTAQLDITFTLTQN